MVVILSLTTVKNMNCEYIPLVLFESTILKQKTEKPLLTRDITDLVSNAPVICEEAEQVVFYCGSILHLILWSKNIRCQDTELRY